MTAGTIAPNSCLPVCVLPLSTTRPADIAALAVLAGLKRQQPRKRVIRKQKARERSAAQKAEDHMNWIELMASDELQRLVASLVANTVHVRAERRKELILLLIDNGSGGGEGRRR